MKVSFLQLPLCWVTPFSVDEPFLFISLLYVLITLGGWGIIPLPLLENMLSRLLSPSLLLLSLVPLVLPVVLEVEDDGNSEARALRPLDPVVVSDPVPVLPVEPEEELAAEPEVRADRPEVKEERSN